MQTDTPAETKNQHDNTWTPNSWRDYPVLQLPDYKNTAKREGVFKELKKFPPLVTSWEINRLKDKIAEAQRGNALILQGGDCAETFKNTNHDKVVNLLKVLLQMSFILIHETRKPVIRIGRLAGQYAKPRSSHFEEVNGEKIPNYRGDLFNRFDATSEARELDSDRLIEGYHKAAMTLNFIRALMDEGFADLHHPEYWELDFMKNNRFYKEYEAMVSSINQAVTFVESVANSTFQMLQNVNIYTSHEALNLYYDSAQTQQVPRRDGWYNLSAHMVWLGNRTRNIGQAHVEYFRGIENPVGIKVGPPFELDEIIRLVKIVNPDNEDGKVVLITRFGREKVGEQLPPLIQAVESEGLPVTWICDPMHGNTFATDDGVKTRNFDDILTEVKDTFAIHNAEGTHMGGIHLELTGNNVTECVGGSQGLNEQGLSSNYETFCDPRLNYQQSLEMAFLIAKEWQLSQK